MTSQSTNDLLSICKTFDQAMLVTHKKDGGMLARPMFIAELEDNGDLWFATDSTSGKVEEILWNPKVCVTMSDGVRFVSISGLAEVKHDLEKIHSLWREQWLVWFPGGPSDTSLVLLKVNAHEGEFWSNAGSNRFKYLFQAAKAYVQGKKPTIDDSQHAKVAL